MCGPTSAIGLEEHERRAWALVKERLRQPHGLAGLMRGFLGAEEVAVVIDTAPAGQVRPLAVLMTAAMTEETVVAEGAAGQGPVPAQAGGYDVEVLLDGAGDRRSPVAMLVSPWMHEHLVLYARRLWSRPARG